MRIRLKGRLKGKRKIAGKLDEVEDNIVRIISQHGEKVSFSLADIAKANLDVDWDKEFQGPRGTK